MLLCPLRARSASDAGLPEKTDEAVPETPERMGDPHHLPHSASEGSTTPGCDGPGRLAISALLPGFCRTPAPVSLSLLSGPVRPWT